MPTPDELIRYMRQNGITDYGEAAKKMRQSTAPTKPTPEGLVQYMRQNNIDDYSEGAKQYRASFQTVKPTVSQSPVLSKLGGLTSAVVDYAKANPIKPVMSVAGANRLDPIQSVTPKQQSVYAISQQQAQNYDPNDPNSLAPYMQSVLGEYDKQGKAVEKYQTSVQQAGGYTEEEIKAAQNIVKASEAPGMNINKAIDMAMQGATPEQKERMRQLVAPQDIVLSDAEWNDFNENISGNPFLTDSVKKQLISLMDAAGGNYTKWQKLAEMEGYDVVKSGILGGIEYGANRFGSGVVNAVRDMSIQAQTSNADQPIFGEQIEQIKESTKDSMFAGEVQKGVRIAEAYQSGVTKKKLETAVQKLMDEQQRQSRESQFLEAGYDVSKGFKYAGNIAGQIGYMAPSIVASYVGGALLGPLFGSGATTAAGAEKAVKLASNLVGLSQFGVQAKGRSMQQYISQGLDYQTANDISTMVAAVEVGTEIIGGGIGGIHPSWGITGKIMAVPAIEKILTSPVGMFAKKMLISAAEEGMEEVLAGVIEPFFVRMLVDPEAPFPTIEELWQQARDAGVTAFFLGGAEAYKETRNAPKLEQQALENINSIPDERANAAFKQATDWFVSPEGNATSTLVQALPAPETQQRNTANDIVRDEVQVYNPNTAEDFAPAEGPLSTRDIAIAAILADDMARNNVTIEQAASKLKTDAPTRQELIEQLAELISTDEYLRGGHGVSLIVPAYEANYDGDAQVRRESRNPIWYQEYAATLQRPVDTRSKADYRRAAESMINGEIGGIQETGFDTELIDQMKRNEEIDRIVEHVKQGGADFIGVRPDASGAVYAQYGQREGYSRAKGNVEAPFSQEVQMRGTERQEQTAPRPVIPRAQKIENVQAYEQGRTPIPVREQTIPSKPVERATTSEAPNRPIIPQAPQNAAQRPTQSDSTQFTAQAGTFVLQTSKGEVQMRIVDERARGVLNKADQTKISNINKVAKALGRKVQWARSITEVENGKTFKSDGIYDPITGTMYIALNSARPYAQIAGHEISHSIEGTPEYDAILKYVVDQSKQDGTYDSKMQRAKELYGEQSTQYLHQELVADKIAEIFDNPTELRKLVNSQRGFVGKVLDALDSLIAKLKKIPQVSEFTALREKLQTALGQTNENGDVRSARRESLEDIANLKEEDAQTPKLKPKMKGEGNKTSEFADSIQETKIFDDKFKGMAKDNAAINYYNGITNKETLDEANKNLNAGGSAYVIQWFNKTKGFTAEDIATGFILMDRYQRAGEYDSMMAVAEKLRGIGTSAGQLVQAFSILGRMTPEGMLVYAQKTLADAFDEMVKGKTQKWIEQNADKFTLTEQEAQLITDKMIKAARLPDCRDKSILLAEVAAIIQDKIPPSGKAVMAYNRISLLLNPLTHVRNILGNTLMFPQFLASDFVGAVIDKSISKKTGVRTTGIPSIKAEAFKKGAFESWDDFRRKINTRVNESGRYELPQGKSFNEDHRSGLFKRPRNAMSRALNYLDRVTTFALDAGDRPFFETWFTSSLNRQMQLNNVTEPTATMVDIATDQALERTWQNRNKITQAASAIRKMFNVIRIPGLNYGLGDMVMKFSMTPANLAKAVIDWSPLPLVKTLTYDAIKLNQSIKDGTATPQTQKAFVNKLSKAVVGTFACSIMTLAAMMRWISGKGDEDKDVADFMKNVLGIQPYAVIIGDKSYSYTWAQPLGTQMAVIADVVDAVMNDKPTVMFGGDDALSTIGNYSVTAAYAALNAFMDNGFMQGVKNVMEADNYIVAVIDAVLGDTSVLVPSVFRQIAALGDDTARAQYDHKSPVTTAINRIKSRIPGLRNELAPQVDVLGREIKSSTNPFDVFLNPTYRSEAKPTRAANEMYRLYKLTGDAGAIAPKAPRSFSDGEKIIYLDSEAYAKFQKTTGRIASEGVSDLVDSDAYDELSSADQLAVVKEIYTYATQTAKSDISAYELGSTQAKAKEAEAKGISPGQYFLYRKVASRNDETTSVSQGDAEAAIMKIGGLSKEQMAWLWYITNTSWKPKNNPFIRGYQP